MLLRCSLSNPLSDPILVCCVVQEAVPAFWKSFLGLHTQPGVRRHEKVSVLVFTIHAFQSLENESVRGQLLPLVSLPLWHSLSRGRLQLELHSHPQLAKHWRHAAKKVCLRSTYTFPPTSLVPASVHQ